MDQSSAMVVRDVESADRAAWCALYAGYRSFYRRADDPNVVETTWQWVSERRHGLRGLVALGADGVPVAFANLRTFARPSSATLGLYLDDLFTAPTARGSGAGSALLRRAAEIAADDGASIVRWITASDNATARRVYDAVGSATPWVTYDMAPAGR